MHGCGNDYIYVNCLQKIISQPEQVSRHLSDRHRGIGSDGMILICPSGRADFRMVMYNADGSEGSMCGNGIRCAAKYVYDKGLTRKKQLSIETKAGIRQLELTVNGGKVSLVKVDMGAPVLEASAIPVITDRDTFIDRSVRICGREYRITCVSMGNPHAVTIVEDTASFPVAKIGPLFEHHPMFPDRVNTEFVQIINQNEIKMRVWERGSAETLACGTGACASVVACALGGYTKDQVRVHLGGGDLDIFYDRRADTVRMTGPAVTVFEGEIDLAGMNE